MARFLEAEEIATTKLEDGDTTIGWYINRRTNSKVVYTVCPVCGKGRWLLERYRRERGKDTACRSCNGKSSYKKNLKFGKDTIRRPLFKGRSQIAIHASDAENLYNTMKDCINEERRICNKHHGSRSTRAWHKTINKAWEELDSRLPALITKCYQMAMEGDMEALREIFNRRFGKVADHVNVDASGQVYMTAETMAQALSRAQMAEAQAKKVRDNGNDSIEQTTTAIAGTSAEGS
jgi:hypothetical protein